MKILILAAAAALTTTPAQTPETSVEYIRDGRIRCLDETQAEIVMQEAFRAGAAVMCQTFGGRPVQVQEGVLCDMSGAAQPQR